MSVVAKGLLKFAESSKQALVSEYFMQLECARAVCFIFLSFFIV